MPFPVYIGGVNTEAVQPASPNFSPLAQRFMRSSKTRATATKKSDTSKYKIEATRGEGLAFDAGIAKEQKIINEAIGLYGTDNLAFINTLPEVRAANKRMEAYVSPGQHNARVQNKGVVESYREYIKEAGGQPDLQTFHNGGGLKSYGQILMDMENAPNLQQTINGRDLLHSVMSPEDAQEKLFESIRISSWATDKNGTNGRTISKQIVDNIKGTWGVLSQKEGIVGQTTENNNRQLFGGKDKEGNRTPGVIDGMVLGSDVMDGLEKGFVLQLERTGAIHLVEGDKIKKEEALFTKDFKPNENYYTKLGDFLSKKINGALAGKSQTTTTYDYPDTGITAFKTIGDNPHRKQMVTDDFKEGFAGFNIGSEFKQQQDFEKEAVSSFHTDYDDFIDIVTQVESGVGFSFSEGNDKDLPKYLRNLSPNARRQFNALARAKGLPPIAAAFDPHYKDYSGIGYLSESYQVREGDARSNTLMYSAVKEAFGVKEGEWMDAAKFAEGIRAGNLYYKGTGFSPNTKIRLKGTFLTNLNGPVVETEYGEPYTDENGQIRRPSKRMVQHGSVLGNKQKERVMKEMRKMYAMGEAAFGKYLEAHPENAALSPSIIGARASITMPFEDFEKFIAQNEFGVPAEFKYIDEDLKDITKKEVNDLIAAHSGKIKVEQKHAGKAGGQTNYIINGQKYSGQNGYKVLQGMVLDDRKGEDIFAGIGLGLVKRGSLKGKEAIDVQGGTIKSNHHLLTVFPSLRIDAAKDQSGNEMRMVSFEGVANVNSIRNEKEINKSYWDQTLKGELGKSTKPTNFLITK